MNKLSRVIAFSVFGLSGSIFAADDDSRRNGGLTNLDTDGDGAVNFEEFQQRGAQSLSRLDSDENGVLTLDELLNARPDFGRPGDRNPDRPEREPSEEQIARMEQRKAEMAARATERFQEMDVNGDDIVSLDEYQEANFLALDRDNNGLLSAEELRPRRPGRRGQGSPRGGRRPQA
tara:strand:- start:32 stop:559 length:528 start_codon:yes stop_codon:yes gene_type:complete